MGQEIDLMVGLEAMPGVVSRAVITREVLRTLGELLIQLANDPTRTGALLFMHEGSDVSISSKGIGTEGGHA